MPQIRGNFTNVNYTPRGTDPSWIVVHNTANGSSREGMAYNNTQYFKDVNRNASATFFIDDGDTIWQCVSERDTAWHCGESASRNGCHNYNSIGIEVCESADGTFTENEIATLGWLVRRLMDEYGIPASRVCRHHDVTGKECPWYYSDDSRWEELKERILESEDDDMSILGFKNPNMYLRRDLPDCDVYQHIYNASKQLTRTDTAGWDNPEGHDFFGRIQIIERDVRENNEKVDGIEKDVREIKEMLEKLVPQESE